MGDERTAEAWESVEFIAARPYGLSSAEADPRNLARVVLDLKSRVEELERREAEQGIGRGGTREKA